MDKQQSKTYPLYIKATFLLLLAILAFQCLVWTEFILVPLTLGSLFSILLTPVATKFEKWGAHRSLSSFLCIIIMALSLQSWFFYSHVRSCHLLMNYHI